MNSDLVGKSTNPRFLRRSTCQLSGETSTSSFLCQTKNLSIVSLCRGEQDYERRVITLCCRFLRLESTLSCHLNLEKYLKHGQSQQHRFEIQLIRFFTKALSVSCRLPKPHLFCFSRLAEINTVKASRCLNFRKRL